MGRNKELDARLLTAAASGDADLARKLIKEGADPQARDSAGRTGMHLAVGQSEYSYGNKTRELIAMFLNRGLDVNDRDGGGATILHHATQDTSYSVGSKIQDLIDFGADINARDRDGRTPLHWAVIKGGRQDHVKQLLESGADIEASDEKGMTALHHAAARGDESVIKALLRAGADIEAETKDGKKCWDSAVDGGQDYQGQWLKAEAAKQKRAAQSKQAEESKKKEAEKPKDPWSLLGEDRVACTTVEKAIGYKLTEIFNFSARTYTKISQNLSTKAEAVTVKSFDEFADKAPLEKAFVELERLGGKTDKGLISGPILEKPRKNLKLRPPEH